MPIETTPSLAKKAGSPAPVIPLSEHMEIEDTIPGRDHHGSEQEVADIFDVQSSSESSSEKSETEDNLKNPRGPNEQSDIVCFF
jgi:hypothetical protein